MSHADRRGSATLALLWEALAHGVTAVPYAATRGTRRDPREKPEPHVHARRGRSLISLCLTGLLAALLLGGCATTVTPIKTLLDDGRRFDGDRVRIVGDVENPMGVLGLGSYQVNDGSGTLRVVSQSGGAPRVGAHVGVEGTFRSAFTIGSEALAVLVENERFSP